MTYHITLIPALIMMPAGGQRNLKSAAGSGIGPANGTGFFKKSYGRGAGEPLTSCPDGWERSGELCYPACEAGYTGDAFVCWQNCPDGFDDTGADCLKPKAYGRGTGYVEWHKEKCIEQNPQGCDKYGLMWWVIFSMHTAVAGITST